MPCDLNHPNNVDVLGDDRMMRHGRVVDVADNGLFVDLLCPNRRREYVPFDRLFRPETASVADLFRTELLSAKVEVLAPATPLGPWIWFPGTLVMFKRRIPLSQYGGAVVRWKRDTSGAQYTHFVPSERIRLPEQTTAILQRLDLQSRGYVLNDPYPCIQPGIFAKGTVPLGDKFLSISTEEAEALIRRLNGQQFDFCRCAVSVTELVDGCLGFVYQRGYQKQDSRWWAMELLDAVDKLHKKPLIQLEISDAALRIHDKVMLPLELWLDVFSHLDTVTQMKLRVVCAAWNQMLEMPALSGRILIGDCCGSKQGYAPFLRLATVFTRLHSGAQHITMDAGNRQTSSDELMMLLDMILYVAQHNPGIRLRSVHLSRFNLKLQIKWGAAITDSGYVSHCFHHESNQSKVKTSAFTDYYFLEDFLAVCSHLPCDAIIMTNCVIDWLSCFSSSTAGHVEVIYIPDMEMPTLRRAVDCDFGCAFFDALETALLEPYERDLRNLSQWLNWLAHGSGEKYKGIVCALLCALQSSDPRPSSHYRGRKWCIDGLQDLQGEKLSRITHHFLAELR